ncbi:MAG: MFS transporter [Euryarchaeota archaeon]|nr:MFS transporter [Euryarchaeota archaeon]MDE1837481.1 MFS transporter [Euryarchaeota archaeon]MDE1880563.1 MFS transporter [Euryarchaeota archaeon]MDE2045553.1 MFS transporter [Thermoplasmata archaeon]
MTTAGAPSRLPPGAVARAMAVLVALRVVYAYNWFDIGPALAPGPHGVLATYPGIPVSALGLPLAAFFAGAAVMQVPAGLLARRHGTKSIGLLGALLLGGAALVGAAAPTFPALLVLRFLAGAGAGIFFSPTIALVASLYPPGERGVPVGIFSSAFAAGAGLGTFLPALLIPRYGWQVSLALGGALMLVLFLLGLRWVPRDTGAPSARPPSASAAPMAALRSKAVWGIGFAFVGLEGASLSTGQFFVAYAQRPPLLWAPALAGAVASLFVFPSLFGGPVGGRLTERFTNRRTQMVVFTALPALLLLLIPYSPIVGVAAIAATFAFAFGMVYAMMYVIPPYLPGLSQEDTPLAIGLLNGIQLAGGATVAAVAGWVIATYGYSMLWVALTIFIIVPLGLLMLVPNADPRKHSVALDPGTA